MNKLIVVLSFALGVAVTAGLASAQDGGGAREPPPAPAVADAPHVPQEYSFVRLQWVMTNLDQPYQADVLRQASEKGWTVVAPLAGPGGQDAWLLLSRPKRQR